MYFVPPQIIEKLPSEFHCGLLLDCLNLVYAAGKKYQSTLHFHRNV